MEATGAGDRGSNPHLRAGAATLGPDLADADVVVIAVHGRGQSPSYMVDHLVDRIVPRLAPEQRDRIAWFLPAAAEQSWYPNGFLSPTDENQPWLDHALEVLECIERDLGDRDPGTVLWCGFSQGACLVSEYLARHPAPVGVRRGGLAALTGGMIGPPDAALVVHGDFAGMPAYFSVGDPDDWVPTWRVHDTASAYGAAGAEVSDEVFPGRPHEIGDAEIEATVALLVPLVTERSTADPHVIDG